VDRAPVAAPVGAGELSIDSVPWAIVEIEGKTLGPTPLAHVRLPAGRHPISLRNPETRQSRTVSITIKADQRTAVRVRLSDGELLRP
jgi:hypothetical protein